MPAALHEQRLVDRFVGHQRQLDHEVERWFALITDALFPVEATAKYKPEPRADTRAWVTGWSEEPRPFICTETAELILQSLGQLLSTILGAGH
jgi:hypothetical protein